MHPATPAPTGPSDPGRVLLAGDTHGDGRWWAELVDAARRAACPVVLQLGDFGYWPGTPRGDAYLDAVNERAEDADVDVWWIAGNHEHWGQLRQLACDADGLGRVRPRVTYVPNGTRWRWSGVAFGALGGARSLDGDRRVAGKTWWPGEEEPSPADVARLGTEPLDVLVTHDVPDGGIDVGRYGVPWLPDRLTTPTARTRRLLLEAAARTRPRLVVHGHWHARHTTVLDLGEGRSTTVEGFAHDRSRSPDAYGVLDLADLSVRSAPGR